LRNTGTTKVPSATFEGARIPSRNRHGKAKPRKGRAVSTAIPLRGEYALGTVTVIDAAELFMGLVVRANQVGAEPFKVESVEVLDFDSIRDGGMAFRTQYVYINGAKRHVLGDAEFVVVHNPRGRGAWDGREILAGPAGRAYVSPVSVTDAVRRALTSKKPGATVPDYKSAFMAPETPDDGSREVFDAAFQVREAEREAAGPERIAPPVEDDDETWEVEFVPLADPPKRKRPELRFWQDFNAHQ